MNSGIQSACITLFPICASIEINAPSITNLEKLQTAIKIYTRNVIQMIHEEIMFPLVRGLLSNDPRIQGTVRQKYFEVLKLILDCVKIRKIKIFLLTLRAIAMNLRYNDEDVTLTGVQCLKSALNSLSVDLLATLYARETFMDVAETLHICSKIVKFERMKNLRICAIECIMIIAGINDEADFTDLELRNQKADAMMLFLPGTMSTLGDVCLSDSKTGHYIIMLALRAFYRLIVLTMGHYESPSIGTIEFVYPPPAVEVSKQNIEEEEQDYERLKRQLREAERSDAWFKYTDIKLLENVKTLKSLQYFYHYKVRYELVEMCFEIITYCSKSMPNTLPECLEILITLTEDPHEEVSKKSKAALQIILLSSPKETLFKITEEKFHEVLIKLPRMLNRIDDLDKTSQLNLLVGLMKFLGSKNMFALLQDTEHLKRLIRCLIFTSELLVGHVSLFEECTIKDFKAIDENIEKWKRFRYIDDKVILTKVREILHLISESEAVEIVVEFLCDIFVNEFGQRNETVFLLNEILSALDKRNDVDSHLAIVRKVLELYIDEENWYLPIHAQGTENVSLFEMHSNIIQACLLVEGIGYMAISLGKTFRQFLFKTLYVVLERAGSGQPAVSSAGLSALSRISKACEYDNVTNVIVENTDYFCYHVVKRIKKIEYNHGVLDVLDIVMKCSTMEVLPAITEIIDGVFLQSCDVNEEHNAVLFLKIFYSFLQNLRRWVDLNPAEECRLLEDYKKQMDFLYKMYGDPLHFDEEDLGKSAQEMYEEDMKEGTESLENEQELKNGHNESSTPAYIKLAVAILQRSLNFLANTRRDYKLLVLNILTEGVLIVRKWTNELFRVVYLIWSPLVGRFKELSDALVFNKSFELLTVLATLTTDFIRSRTSKKVFPAICDSLKKLSEGSYLKDRGSAYRYTQTYKLQQLILSKLAKLVTDLDMRLEDVEKALNAVMPYLSNKQPNVLQECAFSFYKSMVLYDFDSVWLHLINLRGCETQEHNTYNEFKKNTERLLEAFEVIHW